MTETRSKDCDSHPQERVDAAFSSTRTTKTHGERGGQAGLEMVVMESVSHSFHFQSLVSTDGSKVRPISVNLIQIFLLPDVLLLNTIGEVKSSLQTWTPEGHRGGREAPTTSRGQRLSVFFLMFRPDRKSW